MSRAILPEDSTESFAAHGRDERHIVHILGGDRIDGENTFLEEGGIFPDARNTPNGDRHPRERRPVEYLDDGNVNGGLDPLCCGGNLFFRRVFCGRRLPELPWSADVLPPMVFPQTCRRGCRPR
jgi:hypothetical protein